MKGDDGVGGPLGRGAVKITSGEVCHLQGSLELVAGAWPRRKRKGPEPQASCQWIFRHKVFMNKGTDSPVLVLKSPISFDYSDWGTLLHYFLLHRSPWQHLPVAMWMITIWCKQGDIFCESDLKAEILHGAIISRRNPCLVLSPRRVVEPRLKGSYPQREGRDTRTHTMERAPHTLHPLQCAP